MVTVVRGNVILCDLNPVVGTEQAGVRPALVVQIDRANTVSPHTIIAPFTTRIRRAVLPSHALIPAGIGGLTHDSVVLCEQIRGIDKRRIIRVLGRGNAIKREAELQLLLSILWRASSTAITSYGGRTATPVHFKLASNTRLVRILEQRKDATASGQPFPPIAIVSFTHSDFELAVGHVNALELGDDPEVVFIDASGTTTQAPVQGVPKLIKILFLAASPENEAWLRVDKEMREIRNRLRSSMYRDQFDISDEWAVRAVDLQEHLLRHNPTIVHFSGHGSASGELVLEDLNGLSHPVEVDALRILFSLLGNSIKCVVLNACFSETQARAIAETVDCVVGMSDTIGDDSAIAFASSFYQALGYGQSIKSAFDLGCNQIHISALNEQEIPKLLVRSGVDPANVFLSLQSP